MCFSRGREDVLATLGRFISSFHRLMAAVIMCCVWSVHVHTWLGRLLHLLLPLIPTPPPTHPPPPPPGGSAFDSRLGFDIYRGGRPLLRCLHVTAACDLGHYRMDVSLAELLDDPFHLEVLKSCTWCYLTRLCAAYLPDWLKEKIKGKAHQGTCSEWNVIQRGGGADVSSSYVSGLI